MRDTKETQRTTNAHALIGIPRAELERRLKLLELLTDSERELLREIWYRSDHDRIFNRRRGAPLHSFD